MIQSFSSKAILFALTLVMLISAHSIAEQPQLQHYELRIYKIFDVDKQKMTDAYLRDALLPALNRQQIENVGAFHNLDDPNDHSVFVIIPFASLDQYANYNSKLGTDAEYQSAAAAYMDRAKDDGVFARIESRLLKAFTSIPTMELPENSKNNADRLFELRLYESHTEEHARLKVKMFNEGETQLMRDVELAPIFFGESLAGPDLPNLIYMLSAPNKEAHDAHWKAFLESERWKTMKELPQYKDTVSKIKNWFLTPTPFSQF